MYHFRRITVLFVLCACLTAQVPQDSTKWVPDIVATAYSGPNSILLTWESPDDINFIKGRVLRSGSLSGPYEEIYTFNNSDNQRYLDTTVGFNERQFYIIEAVSEDGVFYSNDRQTPAFERVDLSSKRVAGLNISSPVELIILGAESKLDMTLDKFTRDHLKYLWNSENDLKATDLISEDLLGQFEVIPEYLNTFRDTSFTKFINSFNDSISYLITNKALMTPAEWQEAFEETRDRVTERSEDVLDLYEEAESLLDELPDLMINGISNTSDSLMISVVSLSLDESLNSGWGINTGKDLINIDTEGLVFGQPAILNLPKSDSIWLEGNNTKVYYQIPPINSTINFLLSGPVIFQYSNEFLPIKYSVNNSELVLNEISWNNFSLDLELYGNLEFSDQLGVFLNDSLIWQIETVEPLFDAFIDSSFQIRIDTEEMISILDLRIITFDSSYTVESYIISGGPSIIAKIPNGERWVPVVSKSLGISNTSVQSMNQAIEVPELFAMYQNYPNPFNSKTRISFDLLEDSKVSLYVSDARGHIVEYFIADQQMNRGTYHFSWSGQNFSSGVYFFTLSAEVQGFQPVIQSRKMIHMK